MKYALIALCLAFVGMTGYTASLIRIQGHANFEVSFNEPTYSVEDEARDQIALALPPITNRKK